MSLTKRRTSSVDDEARRRRVPREDVEHLLAVVLAAAGLDHVAEDDLLARVVQARLEDEAAALPAGPEIVQPVNARATSVTSFCV